MDTKIFDKMVYKGIKSCPETMKFLEDQASEIFQIELTKWKDKHSQEEFEDSENWVEFYRSSERKFEKYLHEWLIDTSWKINLMNFQDKMPLPILKVFDSCIDLMVENVDLSELAYEIITEKVYEDFLNSKK